MQGTLGKNFLSDNGSTSNDAAVDCQISLDILQASSSSRRSDYRNPASSQVHIPPYLQQHDGRNAEWCVGESSSAAEDCLGAWRGSSFERLYEEQQHHSAPNPIEVTESRNESFGLHNSGLVSEALAQDLNESAGFEDVEEEGFLSNHTSAFRTIGTSNEQHPIRGSSDCLDLLADCGGFVLEGREDRGGCSLDARRMPYKRKAVEARTSNSVGSSERTERSQWHAHQQSLPIAAASDISLPLRTESDLNVNNGSNHTNSRIRIGVGGAFSANPPFLTASQRPETPGRNLLQGTSGFNQQQPVSGNNFLDSGSAEASRLSLRNYLYELNQSPALGSGSRHGQLISQAPPLRGTRWSAGSSRRTSSSSTSGVRNGTPRNVPISLSEHPVFHPGDEIGNLPEFQSMNWNSTSGNLCLGGHVGSTSRGSSSRATAPLSSPGWSLRGGSRYHQRLSEMMRRSLLSSVGGTPNSNHSVQASSSSAAIPAAVPDTPRHHRASNSRTAQLEMHLDGALGAPPYTLRTSAGSNEGRRNIMSEQIRHVLELMRRGESLRFEDMMLLDHSVLFGMADIHDRHRDLRMDVDNMSYEELLALEERIGNVCTGLSEDTIAKHLKKRKYAEVIQVEAEKEPCCICREEYVAGEDIGELNCGHDFHRHCIRQWLMQKNLCPICKTTGLNP